MRGSDAEPVENRRRASRVGTVGILVLYASHAAYYTWRGEINADESFYLVAARRAMAGDLPYRDFAYSQMPALPYLNGAVMSIIGFGFLHQRIVNVCWGFASITILLVAGVKRDYWRVCAWAAVALAAAPWWISLIAVGKTYAAAGLLLLTAGVTVVSSGSFRARIVGFAVAGVLAVGCRLSVVLAVMTLLVTLAAQGTRFRTRVGVVAFVGTLAILAFGVFFLLDPESFLFWNVEYHASTAMRWSLKRPLRETLMLAPGVLVLMAFAITVMEYRRSIELAPETGVMLAALVGVGTQLMLPAPYGEASTPFMPLGALGAAFVIARGTRLPWWRRHVWIVVSVGILVAALGPLPPIRLQLWSSIRSAAAYLAGHTGTSGRVLTPVPVVAIEAHRPIFPGLEMGMFGMTIDMPPERARRLHLATPFEIGGLLAERVPAAVVLIRQSSRWNFGWTVPSLWPVDARTRNAIMEPLAREYHPTFKNDLFVVYLRRHEPK